MFPVADLHVVKIVFPGRETIVLCDRPGADRPISSKDWTRHVNAPAAILYWWRFVGAWGLHRADGLSLSDQSCIITDHKPAAALLNCSFCCVNYDTQCNELTQQLLFVLTLWPAVEQLLQFVWISLPQMNLCQSMLWIYFAADNDFW